MTIKKFEFNMFPVNCYVLYDETKEAVVIDPGCFYEEERVAFKNFIEKEGLKLTHLLNTHLHVDHIMGNPFIQKEYGLEAEACKLDEFLLEQADAQCRMFGFNLPEMPKPLGRYIEEGETITFGNQIELKTIHIPGHSPGGMVFYCEKEKCMFCGDVLFQGSVGRTDLAGGSYNDLHVNILKKLFTLPGDVTVYPGHGPATSIEVEKTTNPFFR